MSEIKVQWSINDPSVLEIHLQDILWRSVSKSLFSSMLRGISLEISEGEFKRIFSENEQKIALNYTLQLLSKRSLFISELKLKLQSKGFSSKAIDAAISYSQKIGALSEDRKLKYLVEKAAEKGKGEMFIRAMLRKYQIEESKIDECFAELSLDPKVAIGKLLEKKLKKYSMKDTLQKKKMIHFLQRRGFQLDDIFSVISEK
ncbi:MAG: regulatory protein RecX [Chlamydiae bacterium]|nr:regulatory protein RecX [Chlamydiota bacterium]